MNRIVAAFEDMWEYVISEGEQTEEGNRIRAVKDGFVAEKITYGSTEVRKFVGNGIVVECYNGHPIFNVCGELRLMKALESIRTQ